MSGFDENPFGEPTFSDPFEVIDFKKFDLIPTCLPK